MARKQSIHYVNNATFSQAVVDYVSHVEKCKKEKESLPKVPDYIAPVSYTHLTLPTI